MKKKISAVLLGIALILMIIGMIAANYNCGCEIWFMVAVIFFETAIVTFICRKYLGIILCEIISITIFIMLYVLSGGWNKLLIIGIVLCLVELGVYGIKYKMRRH